MKKSFIDCHCHVFNLVDVPMYLTISDKLKMGTIKRFGLAIGGSLFLAKNIFDKDTLESALENYKEFILFFERSVEKNIEFMFEEIRDHLKENPNWSFDDKILITPLIMDFDVVLKKELPNENLKEPTVKEQYKRLKDAVENVKESIPNMTVCPFVGFDLRKLLDNKLENFKTFWKENSTLAKKDERISIDNLVSGKSLGIKLYPAIGFNPCPKKMPTEYEKFYEWCCDRDIPITIHTQKDSYEVGEEKKNSDKNTSPKNWIRFFEKYEHLRGLRINFAHFGGEDGVNDLFTDPNVPEDEEQDENNPFFTPNENSWTYKIIKLLKEYDNTYADISAYDYSDIKYRKNLAKVFKYDENGKFGNGHKLKDKLLWGSDVPMVVSDKSYRKDFEKGEESKYRHYFEGFLKSVKELNNLGNVIVENLTEKNPKKFLRLS